MTAEKYFSFSLVRRALLLSLYCRTCLCICDLRIVENEKERERGYVSESLESMCDFREERQHNIHVLPNKNFNDANVNFSLVEAAWQEHSKL